MDVARLLGLLVPVITSLFSLIFLAFWLRERALRYLLAVSGAFALIACGFILSQFLIPKASVLNATVSAPIYMVAISLLIAAACLRRDISVPISALATASIIGLSATIWIGLTGAGISPRIVAMNITLATLFFIGCARLSIPAKPGPIDRALFWALLIIGAELCLVTLTSVAGQSSLSVENYHQSLYWLMLNMTVAISLLTLAAILLAGAMQDVIASVREEAETDLLTGLRTRRAFDREATQLLDNTALPTAIIIIDIDHFKMVNDVYGHAVGDRVLTEIGSLIRKAASEYSIAGRVGGEEFCVVSPDTELPAARLFAEALRQTVADLMLDDLPEDQQLTVSMGVAIHKSGDVFAKTYERADAALYRAKAAGRNRVSFALLQVPRPENNAQGVG